MAVPVWIKAAVRRDEPVSMDGFMFYPVRVWEMEDFLPAREALGYMLARLPAKYAVFPHLAAFFALDAQRLADGESPTGLFSGCLRMLALSLRVGEGEPMEERLRRFNVIVNPETGGLLYVSFYIDGLTQAQVTPEMFSRWRPILAYQNGVEIHDESENPELIDAKAELDSVSGVRLKGDFDSLISAMAAVCREDESELLDWTVRKFFSRKAAVDRIFNHLICQIGESTGFVKYKKGNPYPSWCFDRETGPGGVMEWSEFMAGKDAAMAEKKS